MSHEQDNQHQQGHEQHQQEHHNDHGHEQHHQEQQQHHETVVVQQESFAVVQQTDDKHQHNNDHDHAHQEQQHNTDHQQQHAKDDNEHVKKLEHKVKDLEHENEKLNKDHEKLKAEHDAQVKLLQAQVAEKEATVLGIQEGVLKIMEESERAAVAKAQQLEHQIKEITHEKDQLAQRIKVIDTLDDKVQKLTAEKAEQLDNVNKLQQKLDEAEYFLKEGQDRIRVMKVEGEAQSRKVEAFEATIRALEEQLAKTFNGTDQKAAQDLERRLQEAIAKVEGYEQQNKILQQRLDTLNEEKGDLLGELTQDDDSLHTLAQITTANAEEIEALRSLVRKHETKSKQLEQSLLNEIATRTNIARELEAVKTQLRTKDDEIKRVQNVKSVNEQAALKQKDQRIGETEQTISQLKSENINLQKQLDALKHGGQVTSPAWKIFQTAAIIATGAGIVAKILLSRK
jgi:chromosome segregation ATPase